MGIRELREKYGRTLKGFVAINVAIREELPGGRELIDALGALRAYLQKCPDDRAARLAYANLQKSRAPLADEIARRYDLASSRDEQP